MGAFVIFLLLIIGGLIWYIKRRNDKEAALIAQRIESSMNLKRTMAMGLASRFNFPRTKNDNNEWEFEKATNLFLRQTPLEFEDFVADIFRKKFGGYVYTTSKLGDFGVDFENEREEGLYLGQVKAYKDDVGFEPIALLHSNMVKRGAKGGYVVTTSDFTSAAKEYANGLDITLINGTQLVTYWLETMESKVYEPKEEFA
ncbi:restriction endonuclease [Virgibacillus sp. 179-BFC.A HS]|uniref:Restriction endonuclease n=1 Tax=Tigheibacillus jepli TaxID=3035914 RepID=A0ABU5CDB8_9BACI|nr:restriction endonuclease [Virgibacillus sp. 179-BFC.A HS]MDY0404328.1 restriction endonuclease [Virgibacillus sp. 179-BFC.A HS]